MSAIQKQTDQSMLKANRTDIEPPDFRTVPIGGLIVAIFNARLRLVCEAAMLDDDDPKTEAMRHEIAALDVAVRRLMAEATEPVAFSKTGTCPICSKASIRNWEFVGDHAKCLAF
jgi:hypothetical protein